MLQNTGNLARACILQPLLHFVFSACKDHNFDQTINAPMRETDALVRVNDAPMRVNDAQVRVADAPVRVMG